MCKSWTAALQQVFERHEILRTSLQSAPCANAPVQVVSAKCMARTDKYDLSGYDPARQEESIDRLYREMGDLAFDLSTGPLIRMSLLTLSPDRHTLLVNLSSFCADAASLDNLVREVSRCYSALLVGEELSDEPLQYADASQWQNDLLESADAEEGRKYWRERNVSTVERLRLPAQGSLSGHSIFAPRLLSSQLDRDLSANIATLVRKYETSPSVLLLTCWQILLWRLSVQSDFLVEVTSDGRTYEGLQEALGSFAKSLPMVCRLEGGLRLSELLERTKVSAHDAIAWQEYFSWDDSPRSDNNFDSLSHLPVGFEFREDHAKHCADTVSFVIQKRYVCSDRFALKLCCVRTKDSFTIELQYDSSLFRAEDVDRIQAEYDTLLHSVALNPDTRIDDYEIVGEMERQQLIDFNTVDAGPVNDQCIHGLFEEQVERTPDSIALVFEGKHLTYAELNSRANQVAHRLRTLGVGADVPVAICMERCLEMVVGILGILKAGGAYVPLDPEYPADRLIYMLKDVDASVLLTLRRVADRMPPHEGTVLCLDTDWDSIAGHSDKNPLDSAATSDRDLAYVIYTSGSTGSPKGVMVEHAGLVNAVNWIAGTLKLSHLDRCLLKTPITFDAAGRELFPILISGGTLVITEPNGHRDCRYLAEMIQRERITILHCVPSLLRLIVEEPAFEDASTMRAVMSGGEALTPQTVKRFQSRIGAKLYNVYGPTETIIDSTYWPVAESGEQSNVSIGRPIPNAQVYILDDLFRRVAIGVTGHLYIGGIGLARGYVGRPELTGDKFVPDPFSGKLGARLYKTGDLARYRPDGNIDYLGRGDHQVKIRGFRIELGEIEGTLALHPAVLEAIVLVHEDESGDKRLLAYVTAQEETYSTASELRTFLKDRLPEHMMPAAFIVLDSFPLNANGKVNRRALPAPDAQRPELDEAFVACRTPTEELLAQIWAHVLGVQRVGIHDNFFQLGGHSLLATQVVSRIREAFKVEMPLRHLFETPTVAGLAERIDAHDGAALQGPPIVPVPRDSELPLSFAQQRLWFIDQLEPGSVYNFPAAVRLKGQLNVAALKLSLNEIVKRHESLRTTFTTVDGRPVQVIAPHLTMALPILDLRELPETEREAEVQRLATNEAQRPFDLAEGPLVRATVLRLGENEHVGLLTMHHIVTDGWSAGILIREMAILYDAFRSDRPASLPEMPVQYADFAHWQRNWLAGEVLETQLSYWKEQLLGAPPLLELPTDHPRPAIQTFHGAHQSILLTPIVGDRLKALSRQEGVTLFMTMLAAFQVLLQGYSNQDDLVIGTPIANRNRLETEGLIGFFVNTLVLRTGLSGNPTFRDLLRRVREVCLGAYAHQDLPFEKLVEELHLARDLSRNPLFQVMFVLQNTPLQAVDLPGLSLIPVEVDTATTHFDLTMHFADTVQGFLGTLTYNTDLFEAATVARMLTHFESLLEVIAEAPERRLSDLPLLSEAEQHNILVTFNDTKADKLGDACIPQLFEAQVERTPAAIAVVLDDQQLSYEELNHRANQLANHLRLLGVKPEAPVAMCLKHSVDMVIGLLAILKAGGVYVPLDPAYPKERLAFILEDAQVPVLLAHASLLPGLPQHNAQVVCLDSDLETIAQASAENPFCLTMPENLAYIIYTSGSTGRPKGVLISHASIAAHCLSGQKYYALDSTDRVLQFASLSFDLSLEQIMPTLVAGARLVMMSTDVWDITEFHKKVSESGLTVLNVPTSYWNELARHWAGLSTLVLALQARVFIVGGDTMLPEFVDLWNRTPLRSTRLINAYGPTETTITATVFDVASCEGSTLRRIPIGRPLTNRETYILNQHGNPVPVGVAGELYIGGDCLARGYLNRADLTAENFVPNPFSGEPGARLYKTGDRATLSVGWQHRVPRPNRSAGKDSRVSRRAWRNRVRSSPTSCCARGCCRRSRARARGETAGRLRRRSARLTTDGWRVAGLSEGEAAGLSDAFGLCADRCSAIDAQREG